MIKDKNDRDVPHWPDCKCILCAKFSAICKCERCGEEGREFKTFPAYRRHQTYKPKLKRGSKNPPRSAVVPDGLGFLHKVLANQDQIQKYNLSVISRFCAALNDMRPTQHNGKFTRVHKRLLEELLASESNTLSPFRLELPATQSKAVLKLAQSVNTSPNSVLALLVSYGLELLSKELRSNSVAPPIGDPKINKTVMVERQTAAQEFLREDPVKHVVTEYSTPANPLSAVNRSRFIPSSKET